jgi:hypothetical protein
MGFLMENMSLQTSSWPFFCILHGQELVLACYKRGFSKVVRLSASKYSNLIYLIMNAHYFVFRYIRRVTKMLVGSFYCKYVKLLPMDNVPPHILNEPKFYPYFKDSSGAIDGSQFNSWVAEEATVHSRNQKGFISQNVLAICDGNLHFLYILSGWEGSAADSRVFEYARSRDLHLPRPYYFLADAGSPLCDMLMTPYRGVRYHLKEWGQGNQKYFSIYFILSLSLSDSNFF